MLTLSTVQLILGYFNIDGLDVIKHSRLHNMLHIYEMIVSVPTHLNGTALDYVYLLKAVLHNKEIHCSTKNIYFLGHD